jgi:hypothetical protein
MDRASLGDEALIVFKTDSCLLIINYNFMIFKGMAKRLPFVGKMGQPCCKFYGGYIQP